MKNKFRKLIYVLAVLGLVVSSCEWEPIMWDESKIFVAFMGSSSSIAEETQSAMPIVVAVTAIEGSPSVTVNFEFDTVGIAASSAALEGSEFTLVNDSKSLSFPNGYGYDTIWIMPVDNDIFTGDRYFNITLTSNSQDYEFGANESHTVTLKDNEHPLGKWLGTYAVDAKSYGDPGNWDEAWTVVTTPDPSDPTILIMNGIGGPSYSSFIDVRAVVDVDNLTLEIAAGSEIGTHGNYGGPLSIFFGDEAGGIADETSPMPGTLSEDGSIHIDHMAIKFTGGINTGYVWDSFDTYWTQAAKKTASKKTGSLGRPGLIEQ